MSSEARYRELVERLPVVVYAETDEPEPRSLYMSPNVEELLGRSAAEFVEDQALWMRMTHPDDRAEVRERWEEAVAERNTFRHDYRMIRPDGRTVWIRDHIGPVRGENGSVLFWQGVLEDVSDRRRVQEDLRRSQARYRALVEQVPAIVYEMGPDDERKTLFVSPHAEELLGYDRQEWLDQPDIWIELLHPEDRETELAAMDRHNATGEPWGREYRLIASDGAVVWVHDQAKLVHDPQTGSATWYGVMLDISERRGLENRFRLLNDDLEDRVARRTAELAEAVELMGLEIGERRRVERELVEEHRRFQRLVGDVPAIVYSWVITWDDQNHWVSGSRPYTSPRIEPILGFTAAEWGVDFWKERLHPHDRDRVMALVEHSLSTGEGFDAEYRYLAKDGSVVWVLDQASLLRRDDEGRPGVFQGAMLDITARKEAEQKAADVEARYRMLAEEGPVVFYVFDLDHSTDPPSMLIDYLSPQMADMLGFEVTWWRDEPERWFDLVHPDDRETLFASATRVWRTGEQWANDYRLIASDGRIVWVRDEGRLVSRDDLGRPSRFQGMVQDITARKEEDLELRATSRLHRELLEGIPALPWAASVDPVSGRERYTYVGPQSLDLLGYVPEELVSEAGHFERMLHPEDRERILAANQRSNQTGVWDERYRLVPRGGGVIAVHSVGHRVTPPDIVPQLWQGIATIESTESMDAAAPEGRAEV